VRVNITKYKILTPVAPGLSSRELGMRIGKNLMMKLPTNKTKYIFLKHCGGIKITCFKHKYYFWTLLYYYWSISTL